MGKSLFHCFDLCQEVNTATTVTEAANKTVSGSRLRQAPLATAGWQSLLAGWNVRSDCVCMETNYTFDTEKCSQVPNLTNPCSCQVIVGLFAFPPFSVVKQNCTLIVFVLFQIVTKFLVFCMNGATSLLGN